MSKRRNPVARHSRTYNKSHVMTDRKKADKRGYQKHKAKGVCNEGKKLP